MRCPLQDQRYQYQWKKHIVLTRTLRLSDTIDQATMAEKRKAEEKGINWRNSAARFMILEDLAAEVLPVEEDVCSAEEAWEYYGQLAEFEDVPFSQFEYQLKQHRKQVDDKFMSAMKHWAVLQEDRAKHSKRTTYDNGRRIFRHSAAYKKLHEDVYARRHLSLSPTALWKTKGEYQEWEVEEFRPRIYQMERQWKFVNYLEKKREDEKREKELAKIHEYRKKVEEKAKKQKK